MFGKLQFVALLLVPISLMTASSRAKVYRNQQFGIQLPIPKGVLSCPRSSGDNYDGEILMLGPADRNSCANIADNYEQIRFIEISAEYNVLQDTLHLLDFLIGECAGLPKGPCRNPPYGLQIPGLTSASARVDHPDGWTFIIVVSEAGTPAPDVDPTVPSMHYTIMLHSNKKYLQKDLTVLRKVLKTIQINPK